MSTLITKDNIKLIFKYFALGIMFALGLTLALFLIETVFNIGIYLGTFMRNIYNLICSG